MFRFRGNHQSPKVAPKYHFAFPPSMNDSSFCSASLSAIGGVSVPDFGHCNSVMVSHCFNLHLPDDTWYEVSFHTLFCHLYIFFGEVFIEVFGLYFNWVICFLLYSFIIWITVLYQILSNSANNSSQSLAYLSTYILYWVI